MTAFLWNLLFLLISLGILVSFHEFGHFWVARRCGIKVLVFKIGFGNTIWSKKAKDGVSYEIGAIPLGGYVKMLDSRDQDVDSSQLSVCFDQQNLLKRFCVVAAGPIANFILAILIFWWMFMLGQTKLAPVIESIKPQSVAEVAGIEPMDEILSVGNSRVNTWSDAILALLHYVGEAGQIDMRLRSENGSEKNVKLSVDKWIETKNGPEILDSLGISVYNIRLLPILATVESGSPAADAGMRYGDKIVAINDIATKSVVELVPLIHQNPGKIVKITVLRNTQEIEFAVDLAEKELNGKNIGYLGVSWQFSKHFRLVKYDFVDAFDKAIEKTAELIDLSWSILGKLITGKLSVNNLAGPATIADGAGSNASLGLVYFLGFLGAISVNLGFVNLLPIPMLDGGHLLFLVAEGVRGRAIPDRVQEAALRFGFTLVVLIMLIAIMNDISRFS